MIIVSKAWLQTNLPGLHWRFYRVGQERGLGPKGWGPAVQPWGVCLNPCASVSSSGMWEPDKTGLL